MIGGLALVCASVVATIYLLRRNRNQKAREDSVATHSAPMPAYYAYDVYDQSRKEQNVISELDDQRNSKPSELPG